MKYLLILLLTSCATSTKYIVVHEPLKIKPICIFEKFTEAEKDTMTNEVGSKIYRNQQTCKIKENTAIKDINTHNEAHNDK
jgi:hypothetical protein